MVGIDSDRQIPADRSIYVGEYANFNLVVFPVDYECVESDFSCDTAGVTLSLLEGYTNVLTVAVADTVTPGTEVNVFFVSQKIMHVTAVAQEPVGPVITSCQGVGTSKEDASSKSLTNVGAMLSNFVDGAGSYYVRINGSALSDLPYPTLVNDAITSFNYEAGDDHVFVNFDTNGYIEGEAELKFGDVVACLIG